MLSDRGDYPLCYHRPITPQLTPHKEEVDCRYCLIALREQES